LSATEERVKNLKSVSKIRAKGYYLGPATGRVYAQTGSRIEEWQKWSVSDADWVPSSNPGDAVFFLNGFLNLDWEDK